MIDGARKLPTHHLTIRVPWHDDGWAGTVCKRPRENTSCLVLSRIGASRDDVAEERCAGQRLDVMKDEDRPPCKGERVSFMAPFPIDRKVNHPYVKTSPETHGHFEETPFRHLPYSAACVPFRWMLRGVVEGDDSGTAGLAETLQLGYVQEREPKLPFPTGWVQERDNQLVMLDTFFGAIEKQTSLCFFYAKRTPLSEDNRRVIVGVGRVLSVDAAIEYRYKVKNPSLRCVLWERNVVHSVRPGFVDGFLFPYQELLALAEKDTSIHLEELVAFAPNDFFEQYSYGSELLAHDGAIASLVTCAATLRKIKECAPSDWINGAIEWIDRELNRLWKARGAFPGLGSALSAFGLAHGNLIAYAIAAAQARAKNEWTDDPWKMVDAVFANPALLSDGIAECIGPTYQAKWKKLKKERRALIELLSRCAISAEQAKRFWVEAERERAEISITDAELTQNLYRMYELDRKQADPVTFETIDRGIFPDPVIQKAFPVPEPTRLADAIDARRVRALVVDTLELAADEGHTVLPRTWTVQRIRDRALSPSCPLDEDTFSVVEDKFSPLVTSVPIGKADQAFQLDRLVETREIIRVSIRRRAKSPRHFGKYDWSTLVAEGIKKELPTDHDELVIEEKAREEKAAALEQLYASRGSVLIGPAGTGKTTLLKMLCDMREVDKGGVLLLAPTGKARVRLEQQTGKRGAGQTLAQFLLKRHRYDGSTGRYFPNAKAPQCGEYKTVIVDECSMLTEEQFAALLDALTGVERLVLVGDPRQLPPIGAGRPFVDIVDELAPKDIEARFPKCGPGYAELTVTRRQMGVNLDDVLLASHFSGRPLDPGADEVWERLSQNEASAVRLVQWKDANDLHEKIAIELERALRVNGQTDETWFELSLGGTVFDGDGKVYFRAAPEPGGRGGAAAKVEQWQVLSPVRANLHGVDALNRAIQQRFRARARAMAEESTFWRRKIPHPLGPQSILWGDKVINIQNNGRRRTWPRTDDTYVANGDIGIVVGQYKTQKFKGIPEHLEVEFATQPGIRYTYWKNEFSGDDGNPELELAYALTVHKTQGSEFGVTFVVLPNPCRVLSRELLYTALTRHSERLVILHQGPIRELCRYGHEGYSNIATRMTNLFSDALPREVIVGKEKRFLEERLIHRTEDNTLVRSKSEVVIADKLHARKIKYLYEAPLSLEGGAVRYPDFTIANDMGPPFYWEHLGMLENEAYKARWERKFDEYLRSGIKPHDDGGGPNGTLIVTRDKPNGGLDANEIARLIDEVIRGL